MKAGAFGSDIRMEDKTRLLPQVDYPTIQAQASLPGANPQTMPSSVATVLERQFTAANLFDLYSGGPVSFGGKGAHGEP